MSSSQSRIADYVLIHLGDIGASTSEIADDIEELLAHPDRNSGIEQRLEVCRKLIKDNLAYISQGLSDLRAFEAASASRIKVPRPKGKLSIFRP